MNALNPILVETTRGSLVENRHRGTYAVVNAEGDIVMAAGNFRQQFYPRSSLKPIQALAMLESGAADAFSLNEAELAIACASHNGEAEHVNVVNNWLKRLGLGENDLDCGMHLPMGREVAHQLLRQNQQPTPVYNACSGKHTGFLTLTKHLNQPIKGYTQISHPTQQYISKMIALLCDIDLASAPKGIDGCNVPVIGMQVIQLAYGMARLGQPKELPDRIQKPCQHIITAMQNHPFLIAGSGRFCTQLIEKTQGEVIVKMGADGVFSACIPRKNLGIALKVDDGNIKAAEVTLINLLKRLDALPRDPELDRWFSPPIKNWHKDQIGVFRSAL